MRRDVTSPFTPGRPVPTEYFVGRTSEIEKIERKAINATTGRIELAFLAGERGMGKSSVASFCRFLVEQKRQMVGMHVFLGGVESLEEMMRRIFDRLIKDSVETTLWDRIKGLFGDRIKEAGLFGLNLSFDAPDQELRSLVHSFPESMQKILAKLKSDRKGIFLILDDINGLASSSAFANWLKSTVDEIATSGKSLPICIIIVGLDERRQALISLQPSLARILDVIDIRPWSDDECRRFFVEAFKKVNVQVDDVALAFLVKYSGGLPMLAHEIGDSAFNLDDDGKVNDDDAIAAVFSAAEIVGRKHLQQQVFEAIRSEKYRSILRTLSASPVDPTFTRAQALKRLASDEEKRVFDNFIRRMRKLGVITPDAEAGPGAYRFTNRLHYLYFCIEAQRAKSQDKPN